MDGQSTVDGGLGHLIDIVSSLRECALRTERSFEDTVGKVAADHQASARNLLHYVALRQHDLRNLQEELGALGLSSLGRLEGHCLAALDAVLDALHALSGIRRVPPTRAAPVNFRSGKALLADHAQRLLGPCPELRPVRIMVTMPSEAATRPELVLDLLAAGMDLMRINCAHDDAEAWRSMVVHLRNAERQLGRSCRVLMDLGGPKLRTGPMTPEAGVQKVRPQRDDRGNVTVPGRFWLVRQNANAPSSHVGLPALPADEDLIERARAGDRVRTVDIRGRRRVLEVVECDERALLVETTRTLYLAQGCKLELERDGESIGHGKVGVLPPKNAAIELRVDDMLLLTGDSEPGRPALRNKQGDVLEPAQISCTLAAVFRDVQPGHRISFDDGKIGGVIETCDARRLRIRITGAAAHGAKLRADKGINLPDSLLTIAAVTDKDFEDLRVAAEIADIVGLSFVRGPEDVELFEQRRAEIDAGHLGVVLKIETRQAFENLPHLLMVGLRAPPVGVMVARGDLAVEVGFERMAELQEEILWLCEAAHVPVIWATQVLEKLTKHGTPSRAEVTDAAMSGRAECVMLNKGAYVVEATRFLSDVLTRMASHQSKKTAMLRKLAVSNLR